MNELIFFGCTCGGGACLTVPLEVLDRKGITDEKGKTTVVFTRRTVPVGKRFRIYEGDENAKLEPGQAWIRLPSGFRKLEAGEWEPT